MRCKRLKRIRVLWSSDLYSVKKFSRRRKHPHQQPQSVTVETRRRSSGVASHHARPPSARLRAPLPEPQCPHPSAHCRSGLPRHRERSFIARPQAPPSARVRPSGPCALHTLRVRPPRCACTVRAEQFVREFPRAGRREACRRPRARLRQRGLRSSQTLANAATRAAAHGTANSPTAPVAPTSL